MKIRFFSILMILFCSLISTYAQNEKKIKFSRVTNPPKIDGLLNDKSWDVSEITTGFIQSDPYWGQKPKFQTEVEVLFDNKALYIAARMFDDYPDSINRQLGLRDDDLHADYFSIEFDPYNRMQESFYFQVTASGVQTDWKRSDESFNAVWKSKVQIDSLGWTCEMEIPYSAFSFLKCEEQQWRVQFVRYIRRNREYSQLNLEKQMDDNDIQYWSSTENFNGITPPLRLFLQPYLNVAIIGTPDVNSKTNWSKSSKGGLDLKWGINQSSTLEMTLLPDFSQVQSDNLIKNLSAFETVYSDYRPFFNESIAFFEKGGLLYTRRIGRKPRGYENVEDQLDSTESITSNPITSPLINAFKLYGRNSKGLAIGVFNAITNKTEAVIQNQNETRRIQTEPLTNYTLLVIEKAFKNKSNLFLSNANTLRQGNDIQANVTALGGSNYFFQGKYKIYLLGGMSRQSQIGEQIWNQHTSNGFKYDFTFAKVSGKFIFSLNRYVKDKLYNPNDMGVNLVNDEAANNVTITHRTVNPFWKLLNFQETLTIDYANRISTQKETNATLKYSILTTTIKHLTLWSAITWRPLKIYDYYEPRVSGLYYLASRYISGSINFSSDYRRPFALDGSYSFGFLYDHFGNNHSISITPVLRIGNRIGMRLTNVFSENLGQRGYAGELSSSEVVFGKRLVKTYENSYSINYMLRNNLGVVFRGRYYWAQGKYSDFYKLKPDGSLSERIENYSTNHNFTYSIFNIDVSLQWEFAPGSMLYFTYKNEFLNELTNANKSYMEYLKNSFDTPQSYTFALKILYHFDVGSILKKGH